jgi:hypothetical protein
MSELMPGRAFQLWEYHVSHGSLLIRSPAGPDFKTSVDIIFVGVVYLAAPRHLGEIAIAEATIPEIERMEVTLGRKLHQERVWVLQGANQRSIVVALAPTIREHMGDIFDSPFSE